MADFSTTINIDAPPDVVFEHLVVAERMVTWMGERAELNPVASGGFAVDIKGVQFRGEYLAVEPPHRVVVSWGIAGSSEFPPGSSQVEFTLAATSSGTSLRLVHTGVPDAHAAGHASGWRHYLARLGHAALGIDPGVDTFVGRSRN
ncbi:MAG TPA: SRPBCC domain-containing protein [Chloroflexota bacterium]|jgi:uncharacterized protein YndB with AHSA1/START domain